MTSHCELENKQCDFEGYQAGGDLMVNPCPSSEPTGTYFTELRSSANEVYTLHVRVRMG